MENINLTYTNSLQEKGQWSFEAFQEIANKLHQITKEKGEIVWIVDDNNFKKCGFSLHDAMIWIKPDSIPPTHNGTEHKFIFPTTFKIKHNKLIEIMNQGDYGNEFIDTVLKFTKGVMDEMKGSPPTPHFCRTRRNIK